MKHLNKLFVAALMFAGLGAEAQNSKDPWAISFGVNAVDYRTSAGRVDDQSWFEDKFGGMQRVHRDWNILPSVSYLAVDRYIGSGFSAGLQGSINKIEKMSRLNAAGNAYEFFNPGDLSYYGLDARVKYSFADLLGTSWLDPNVNLGGGYTWTGDNSGFTVNGGAGLTFWLTKALGLQLGTQYKKAFENDNMRSHFQHTAGLSFRFGGSEEVIPEPVVAAPLDSDGDGIVDESDACPQVAGLAAFNGCPDTDGDGLADKDDACPNEAGPAENKGCPYLDADKDGISDKDDDCPTVFGPADNKGCPKVNEDTLQQLKVEARSIFFHTGKATLDYAKQGDTNGRLEAIKEILKNYPTAKFSIEGHTDSTGSAKLNQKLSENRAKTVMDALIAKGVKPENLTSAGFGASKPVSSNKTVKGRSENRRTEIRHVGSINEGKL